MNQLPRNLMAHEILINKFSSSVQTLSQIAGDVESKMSHLHAAKGYQVRNN